MSVASRTALDVTTQPVEAALYLARSFTSGRRLVVDAPGCPDHGHHVVVEFLHPVVAGARSLPATMSRSMRRHPDDVVLVIGDPEDRGRPRAEVDLMISAGRPDGEIMRSYHLLWELVQIALEHPGLVGAGASAGGDSTGFLYPFLDAAESDEPALRDALALSAEAKRRDSHALAEGALSANRGPLTSAVAALVRCARQGGTVFTAGNGGSATDAARIVRLLDEVGVDALSLVSDYAVVSALANDLGAEHVFDRQLDALARPGDVLVATSTSGASPNLLAAFDRALSLGVCGLGISGYGGGGFRGHRGVDQCLVVESSSVHRIQEAQASLISDLCASVGRELRP